MCIVQSRLYQIQKAEHGLAHLIDLYVFHPKYTYRQIFLSVHLYMKYPLLPASNKYALGVTVEALCINLKFN